MTRTFFLKTILPAVSLAFLACTGGKQSDRAAGDEVQKPSYSRLFDSQKADRGTILTLYQPADTTRVMRRYFLYKTDSVPPSAPADAVAVHIPVENAACAHSTQVGLIDALGLSDRIKSIGSKAALEKKSALAAREDLDEFFNGWQFDREKLLALSPDAVFFSPGRTENIAALESGLRSPLILELSPWDTHPLARTEWIKFIAEFFDCRAEADSIFAGIEKRYNEVLAEAETNGLRPSVISSLPYQGVWYVPAGESYKSVLFRQAGLVYPWADTGDTGSLPLDMEAVLSKGSQADAWFFETGMGPSPTLASLKEQNKLYTHFKAYQNGDIFICNTDDVPYFEQGIVQPDKVLSDFVYLPRKKDYVPFYYKRIKER